MSYLGKQIQSWIENAPLWNAAELCQERIKRFHHRAGLPSKSSNVPLVVALLGGTGTGKSSLLNALLGEKIVTEGKERPTTNEPVLVCHTNADAFSFSHFRMVRRSNPLLEQMMILDCPDPDTTDTDENNIDKSHTDSNSANFNPANSNLEKLRQALPYCDIILVTVTQQKYRSRKVLDELAVAAPGTRLVFVQTHADKDIDIREDWQKTLESDYEIGEMFFVSSITPAAQTSTANSNHSEANIGLLGLRQLLTRDLNEEAAVRIRQANYFSLAEEAVADCQNFIEKDWQPVCKLRERLSEERQKFGKRLTDKIRSELISDRRIWESKLLGRVSAQWGYSPFSVLLRLYQGFGTILSGALLTRVRSPIQLALWGSMEGVRQMKKRRTSKTSTLPEFSVEESNRLKESALILTGFATDASVTTECCLPSVVHSESKQTHEAMLEKISAELETLTDKIAQRCQRIWFRCFYEILFGAMLLFLLVRPAYNFFIGSIFYSETLLGVDYYVISLLWLIAWGAVLLFFFTLTLRRKIERSIRKSSQDWHRLPALEKLFSSLEKETTKILAFRDELKVIKGFLDRINQQAEKLDKRLGKKRL